MSACSGRTLLLQLTRTPFDRLKQLRLPGFRVAAHEVHRGPDLGERFARWEPEVRRVSNP